MKKMSLRAKLLFYGGAMSTYCFVIGIIGFICFESIVKYNNEFADVIVPRLMHLTEMQDRIKDSTSDLLKLDSVGIGKSFIDEIFKEVDERIAEYNNFEKLYLNLPMIPGEKELFEKTMEKWKEFTVVAGKLKNYFKNPEDEKILNSLLMVTLPKASESYKDTTDGLTAFLNDHIAAMMTDSKNTKNNLEVLLTVIVIAGALICFIFGYFFSNSLVNLLTPIIGSLKVKSENLNQVSDKIAASSQELSEATTEQAASLEQTASAVEELNAMVQKNSKNAESTAISSSSSQQKVIEGNEIVAKMIESMNKISTSNTTIMGQVQKSNAEFEGIVKVIEEIETKTKVINDIVFQTKLLSFNASVEAARAGEHGKGFAVVAEEVGNLAQMSGNAAKEISVLLDNSIQKVHNIVDETRSKVDSLVDEGKNTIEEGIKIVHSCGNIFEEIIQNVSSVTSMAEEISLASKEQANGVDEISKAMIQLDQVTGANSTNSEKSANAAESLSEDANELNNIVTDLVSVVHGGKHDFASVKNDHAQSKGKQSFSKENVVHLKSAPKEVVTKVLSEYQMAVGHDSTPDFDDDGFKDI